MSSDEVLKQLLWKHEATITDLAHQLGGPDAECRIEDIHGNPLWDSEFVACPEGRHEREHAAGGAWEEGAAAPGEPTRLSLESAGPGPGGPASGAAGGATHGAGSRTSLEPGWIVPLAQMGRLVIRTPSPPSNGPTQLAALGRFLIGSMETEEELDRVVEDHIANTNQLVALYHIIGATHETWDLADKLDVMLEEAGRQIGTSLAFLLISQDDEEHFALWPGDDELRRKRARTLLDLCAGEQDAFIGDEPEPFVAAPILVRDEIVGWLGAGERPVGDPLGQRDMKHVSALAELSAGFLQTSRLQDQVVANTKLQRELEIASQIQDMLMPREVPQPKGVGVAASCRPASSVGGDFFVVQKLADERIAFALGDVTGKGVPAALIMAMARTVFRSLTPLSGGAGVVLDRLSEVLYDDLEEVGKFVTLVLGFWDPRAGSLEIANAGHSPVLYRAHADAAFVALEPEQPPLGVLPEPGAPTVTVEFGPGSVFLACSDGVTEARDPDGGFYGDERLQGLIDELGMVEAEALRSRILADVELFSRGAPQSDDQTILILAHGEVESRVEDLPGSDSREVRSRDITAHLGSSGAELRTEHAGGVIASGVDGGGVTVETGLKLLVEYSACLCCRAETAGLSALNREFDRWIQKVISGMPDRAQQETVVCTGEDLKLAVYEAVANIVEHGQVPNDDRVEIAFHANANGLEAEVVSTGTPFDPTATRISPPAPEEMAEGGYGLHLIRSLTDHIGYDSKDGQHTLRLTRLWRAST
ncbi:MAG: SpoIIE family protein phosphatase [Candidatus Eisenbacteria bacterium]|uniref:SpoIIE family protein phosphatase n=1 Tax=Eiseniibacteriota bacterium TaxID=2212470 RepID=A0A956NCK7_UNCEI|nr:SpoIIE family protein phosphatase [Candidatus Eisenbacteria bacterium]